jgi:chemotaxis protein methyltransferase CheR
MILESNLSHVPSPSYKIGYGDYLRFRDLVLAHSGLHFPEHKRLDLETGILKALTETQAVPQDVPHRLEAYYRLLADRADLAGRLELERLVNLLTVGETHFFRDEAQFDALWQRVVPELIARKRQTALAAGPHIQPQLRLWSAGCATGEEPYSLAIMLKELLPDLERWRILILATDINQESLRRAREGVYSDWSFRENRAKALQWRYFTPEHEGQGPARSRYCLSADIKQMVTFASLNLIEEQYPAIPNNTANMDLIICRNVTIYFTQEDTQRIVNHFYQALTEGGWLIVGHAEPALYVYQEFQARSFPGALLYQKTGQPQAWPATWEWADARRPAETTPQHTQQPRSRPFNQGERDKGIISRSHNGQPARTRQTGPLQPLPKTGLLPEVAPAQPTDPYTLARALLEQGKVAEAIDQLQHKLKDDPNFAPAHCLVGRAYANLGHWAEARRWCQSALALDNLAAETYQILGLVYQQDGDLGSAISMLKKAIYLERENPLLHFNLAALYQKVGEPHLAQRSLENTLRLLEKRPPAEVIADSGGVTVSHLQQAVKKMLQGNKRGSALLERK